MIVGRPPEAYGPEFLEWLRAATERAWTATKEWTLADFERAGVGGATWRRGTRWTGGLTAAQIADAERRFDLTFPADHRLFLETLHATTPRLSGARFEERGLVACDRPGFFDWTRDDEALRAAYAWVEEGILEDVGSGSLWSGDWGERPEDLEARYAIVRQEIARAPRLVPMTGHRYLVAAEPSVVLSIYGTDIIVYGSDLRSFLLHELGELLGVEKQLDWTSADARGIPFWGALVG